MERSVASTRESLLGGRGRSVQGGRKFARFGFGLLFAILGAGMIVGLVLALSLPDVPVSDPPTLAFIPSEIPTTSSSSSSQSSVTSSTITSSSLDNT